MSALSSRARTFSLAAIGPALALGYLALLIATEPAIGLSRDEGIYVDAAQRYGAWLEFLTQEPSRSLEREATDSAFRANHEHPPLMKVLFALGHLAHEKSGVFSSDSLSFRFGGMLSAALLVWLIYAFGKRLYGRTAGLFAALVYALLPRPFYHAHLNAFDVPITFASTLVAYTYWRSLRDWRFAIACGLAFGIALLTKHNSWILPGICALHFAILTLVELRARQQTGRRSVGLAPWWLLAMLLFGPPLFVGGWPWMWHDTLDRIRDYTAFHLHHEYYNIEYFGVNFFWPPFPRSYPWIMTLYTVPLTSLVLGVSGAARELTNCVRTLWPLLREPADDAAPGRLAERDPTLTAILLFGMLLAPLVIISLPTTPIFGGTKHWFPAYPMLALFAGRAFQRVIDALPARGQLAQRVSPWIAGLALLAPAAVETAHSHPFALSHYTVAAGGVPGAAEKGMNRQFWGFTTRSLVPHLREALPNGGNLYIGDTIYGSFEMLVRDGFLTPDYRPTGDIARADLALVHHEKHFLEVDTQIWTTYQTVQPEYVLTYDGVPIVSVYRNPH